MWTFAGSRCNKQPLVGHARQYGRSSGRVERRDLRASHQGLGAAPPVEGGCCRTWPPRLLRKFQRRTENHREGPLQGAQRTIPYWTHLSPVEKHRRTGDSGFFHVLFHRFLLVSDNLSVLFSTNSYRGYQRHSPIRTCSRLPTSAFARSTWSHWKACRMKRIVTLPRGKSVHKLLIQAAFSLLYELSFLMLFCRKSLDLVECLIRLSDFGHYQAVTEIFKVPLQQCPDVLVFALLQIVWLSFLLILFAVSCYKHNLNAIVFRMIKSMFVVSFEDGLEQTEARVASILIRPLPLKPPQLRPSPHLCLARTGNTGRCARTASRWITGITLL